LRPCRYDATASPPKPRRFHQIGHRVSIDHSRRFGQRKAPAAFLEANMAPQGLTTVASAYDPATTRERLTAAIIARGMSVIASIDHAEAAAKVGLELRPTEVVMFGNPRAGTGLMQIAQTMGIDLPLKVLIWQDENGKTWLSYNEPRWLAERHGVGPGGEKTLAAMTEALAALAREVGA
jgi:uncharacterized protein (DUF302 family)